MSTYAISLVRSGRTLSRKNVMVGRDAELWSNVAEAARHSLAGLKDTRIRVQDGSGGILISIGASTARAMLAPGPI